MSADKCGEVAPVVKRVCDGDPDSVKREEKVVTTDDGGSTNSCPKNQIGVISKSRESTVTTSYACVEHTVQQVDQKTTYSDWVVENYCRDYVAFRCSQDSLNNTKAGGRYKWMVKCADKVPAIKEFLTKFDDVSITKGSGKSKQEFSLGSEGRVMYATFMSRNSHNSQGSKCEKPWIAPTDPNVSCDVPADVYVAAVCVSSCATPEQQIMAQESANEKLKYVRFDQAWKDKFAFVATLQSQSTMSSKRVQKTRVDQWVTEMVDTTHDVLEFHMKSGGQLRVTANHPIVSGDAFIRQAQDFKVGDSLVLLGGQLDQIVSIDKQEYFGKVYNVFVKSADLHKNIVVTNGYLNGTAMYQNEGAKFLNTQVMRKRLTQGVFGK